MSEPRTAAGRALLDDLGGSSLPGVMREAFRELVVRIEQEAAALDVERLARAMHRAGAMCMQPRALCKADWIGDERHDVHTPWAAAIAREYEKLRTPEGDDPACCHPFASKRPDGPRWCDLCSAIIDIEPEGEG